MTIIFSDQRVRSIPNGGALINGRENFYISFSFKSFVPFGIKLRK